MDRNSIEKLANDLEEATRKLKEQLKQRPDESKEIKEPGIYTTPHMELTRLIIVPDIAIDDRYTEHCVEIFQDNTGTTTSIDELNEMGDTYIKLGNELFFRYARRMIKGE